MDNQATDLVKPANLHKGKGSSLTHDQLKAALAMRQLGKTQTEIAQAIGANQGTVSRWLHDLTDTTELARTYLAGQALPMARNIRKNGLARDHVQVLNGLGVLNQPVSGGVVVNINGLSIHGLGSPSPPTDVVEGETVENP